MKHIIQLLKLANFVTIFVMAHLFYPVLMKAQSPSFAWARQLNGTGVDGGTDVAVGSFTGDIFTTGSFSGMADFDKNGGGRYLNSAGNRDIFISKTDAAGNMLWLKRIGGVNDDMGYDICVDNVENVYVSGRFSGTVDFDPGAGVSNLSSTSQASFILKISGAGNFVYAYMYGGSSIGVYIADIKTDASNNLFAAGQLNGAWDFDPGAGVSTLSAYQDGFIFKLNSSGTFVFAKQIANITAGGLDGINAMCLDASGNIIVTGNLFGSADFDPGAGSAILTSSSSTISNDYYIAKYTSSGIYVWAGLTGGTPGTTIWSQYCTADAAGNIYIAAHSMGGPVDFDITAGVNSKSTANASNWVQKIKSNGTFAWAYPLGTGIELDAIKTNSTNGLFIEGIFRNNTCDFNPGAGTYSLVNSSSSNAYYDVYILKLDTAFNFQWAKNFGASFDDYPGNFCITTSGNIITTGYFTGTGDFDPNAGVVSLNSKGSSDIFISKLNSTGSLTWVYGIGSETYISINAMSAKIASFFSATGSVSALPSANLFHHGGNDIFVARGSSSGTFGYSYCMGGPGSDAGTGIISDAGDNIYITGYFEQTADFAPSRYKPSFTLTSSGAKDIFVLKLNVLGNLVWAKRIGSASDDQATAIALDNTGNLLVTGFFQGTVDFDPGPSTTNLTSAGNTDIFILKMDTAGNFTWAKNAGSTSSDLGNAIAADASGNVLVTGSFYGTSDFDPSAGIVNLTSLGNGDGFVLKLNSSGNFVWVKQTGSAGNDLGKCITTDGNNIFIGGSFGGATDFDPGAGVFTITPPNGNPEIFIQKLSAAGNFVFAKSMGGVSFDQVSGITLDAAGNIYTTGTFYGTADLNPDALGTANFTSNGGSDVFINCYNSILNTSWTKTFGGLQGETSAGIAMDGSNSVYLVGNFGEIVDFNPDAGINNLTAPGESDIFVMKLIQSSPLPVELISFSANAVNNTRVNCTWETASELNNDYYTVERSVDGVTFQPLGRVNGTGNSINKRNYSFMDENPCKGVSYYRLKQTDFDAAFTYSKKVSVLLGNESQITVYPTLTNGQVTIVNSDVTTDCLMTVYNSNGKLILSKMIYGIESRTTFDLSGFSTGIYYIHLANREKTQVFKVIKQ